MKKGTAIFPGWLFPFVYCVAGVDAYQEAASILRNAFKLTESSSETFPDDSAISNWAKESVYIVKASGLMKGDAGTGNFRPTDTIIRAEAASILMNAKHAGLIK